MSPRPAGRVSGCGVEDHMLLSLHNRTVRCRNHDRVAATIYKLGAQHPGKVTASPGIVRNGGGERGPLAGAGELVVAKPKHLAFL